MRKGGDVGPALTRLGGEAGGWRSRSTVDEPRRLGSHSAPPSMPAEGQNDGDDH
jgi:hypothetical protein